MLIGQKAGALARRNKRLREVKEIYLEAEQKIQQLVDDSFFILGLALYWAEGTKQKPWNVSALVSFGNTDESTILLMRNWFKIYFKIPETQLIYRLHIHKSADIGLAKKKWANLLKIKEDRIAVTIKKNDSKFRHNRNLGQYKGLVALKIRKSTQLNRHIDSYVKLAAASFLK